MPGLVGVRRDAPIRPRRDVPQPAAFARHETGPWQWWSSFRNPATAPESRSPPRLPPGTASVSVLPREDGLPAVSTWFLVARFQPRFVPPSPFLTTMAACTSPEPSGLFHPVALLGFGSVWMNSRVERREDGPGGPPTRHATCEPPLPPRRGRRDEPASASFPVARGAAMSMSEWTSTGEPGPVPNAFALDQVKRASVRHDRCIHPGNGYGMRSGNRSSARAPSRSSGSVTRAPAPRRELHDTVRMPAAAGRSETEGNRPARCGEAEPEPTREDLGRKARSIAAAPEGAAPTSAAIRHTTVRRA